MGGRLTTDWRSVVRECGVTLVCALGTLVCGAQPLFPMGCDVVLLAGLPGDAESEAAYREQLQSWVDLACAPGRAGRVFALSDAPEAIRVAAGKQVAVMKNDRRTFLELAETLGGTGKAPVAEGGSNTLVVIAWGHGGRQREGPVLHVRGPRLTPDDFAVLAARASDSQWVLTFRGSGAFAKRLASRRSRVISSDAGQAFNSDPVAMPLVFKLARSDTANSFEALARELGRTTVAWYEERGLARTEEPALWTGENEPQLLAMVSEGAPQLETGKKVPEPRTAAAGEKSGNEASPDLPGKFEPTGAWSTIKKVKASDYPEFDAVVLSQRLVCSLGSNPALSTEQEEFIQVLTPEGKSVGDFDISFAPPHEEIEFGDCEVLRPDGELVRLDPDRIGESREQPVGDYQGPRRKFFSLPGVVPGAILHVRYRTQWKQFPLPQVSLALPLGKEIPARFSTVQISVPKQSAFHWAFEGMAPSDPMIRQTSYAATYTWSFTNVAAQRRELLSPPLQTPRLVFSTFRDWADFAGWYERISRLTGEITPDLEAKARALTAEAKTDRERLVALYNYVTALRYVAVPLGINSVRPHAAANVLQNQFGDCKDKANLLNTLLRCLNIDAHLALVPRFSQAHDAVPGLAFNHAISRVTLGSEFLWLDTTDEVCRFGMLPPGDYGRKVLVIDGRTQTLEELPAANPKDHRLQVKGALDWPSASEAGGAAIRVPVALPVKLEVVAFGYPDYELRAATREARENHASLPLLNARFRPVAGSFALQEQLATAVSALDQDFAWQASGECIGIVAESGARGSNAVSTSVGAPFWLPKEWDLALHRREGPLYLNQGYPLTLEETFQIQLPVMGGRGGSTPQGADGLEVAVPGICENSEGPLRWRVVWARIGDDKLEAQLKAELQSGELSSGQTGDFQRQLRDLLGALAMEASLRWRSKL